jgi:integrase
MPDGMWKRGNAYYARFSVKGKQIRKRLSGDYDAACEILNSLRSRADKADFELVDNDYSFNDLKAEFLGYKKQTSRNPGEYESTLGQFETYCRVLSVRQVTHRYIVGFRNARLAEGISPRTINKQVGILRHMLNKAVEWGRIGSNPIKSVMPLKHDKPTKQRRALTAAEFQAIFDKSNPRLRAIWRMFASTGIRRDELVSLTFDDVDWEARSIVISAGNSKNHKPREIPLDDEMFATLEQLREQAQDRQPVVGKTPKATAQQAKNFSAEHVFVTQANTPWRNNLLQRFYAVCKRAGIADGVQNGAVDIHSLRVSFTTLALEGGASPKAVQAILGHSTLALTMGVYARATDRAKRQVIASLPFARVTEPEHLIQISQLASA